MRRDELRALLPWPQPQSVFDDDGANVSFEMGGHRFRVVATGQLGCDSGRARWQVECVTCDVVIHDGTTSASIRVHQHLEESEWSAPPSSKTKEGER